jgi:hypothetical protein
MSLGLWMRMTLASARRAGCGSGQGRPNKVLQQAAAAILVPRDFESLSAAAAAELLRSTTGGARWQ